MLVEWPPSSNAGKWISRGVRSLEGSNAELTLNATLASHIHKSRSGSFAGADRFDVGRIRKTGFPMSRKFQTYPFVPKRYPATLPALVRGCDPQRQPVCIVGGGISGLATAVGLAR